MPNEPGPALSRAMELNDLPADSTGLDSTDVELVRRAQRGDSSAFAELVKSYQRRAVSVAYRLLGNVDDAADVSQDAFVRAYRNLSQLEDPTRFGAWLMRIVSNLSLNYRRARAARSTASLDDALSAAAVVREPSTGLRMTGRSIALGDALSGELHAAVTDAMGRLPDKQRLALILFSVEGLPQKEVADILECSVELVKWNVFQARKKLREMLGAFL